MPSRYVRENVQPFLEEYRLLRRQKVFDIVLRQILRQPDLFGPGAGGGLPESVELPLLGQLLAAARAAQRVGLRELAAETRIDHKTISHIERGRANPTIDTLQRIATALGKKFQVTLVDETPEKKSAAPRPKPAGPELAGPAPQGPALQGIGARRIDNPFPDTPEFAELPPVPTLEELFALLSPARGGEPG